MAEPSSYMDPGTSKASTKPDQVKNVKDSNFGSPIQTKNIGLTKNPKQESKIDHSGNPKEFIHGLPNKHLSSVCTSHLTHLKKLDLSGRGLAKFPDDLCGCGEVEEINLSNNPLGPSLIFPMSPQLRYSLKKLDLSGCGLTKSPEGFQYLNCYKLEELNLSNNPLGPSFIFSMSSQHCYSLKKLDLSGCDLRMLPEGFQYYCYKLEELNLSNNPLVPPVIFPISPQLCYGLKKLDLSGCGLTKLPEGFQYYCYKLEELNLSNNPLVPPFIFSMSQLRYSLKKLDLSGCGLTKLPEGFQYYCYELEELNLSNNPLVPPFIFPIKLKFWALLKKLDLSGCGLKEWPCALERCSNLQELNLSNNSIGHEELLEELNSGKIFISHLSSYKSGKGLFGPMTRIIFEDTMFTQRNGG